MEAPRRNLLVEFFAVAVRPRTYGALVYLWLGFPLGLAWFVALTVGLATGLGLAIVWIGFAILAVTLGLVWLAEGLERQLAIRLLGARVPERLPAAARQPGTRLRATLVSPALWKGLLFLIVRFPAALACWVTSLVSLIVPAAFATLPALYLFADPADLHFDPPFWSVDSFAATLPFGFAGLLGLLVALHLHVALGWVWARLAEWLLGAETPQPTPTPAAG
jgi:hypothetical protein